LDVYKGPSDPDHQIHDYNPGIEPDGRFWTTPVRHESVQVRDGGKARLHTNDFAIEDYHDVINALKDGPSLEAKVSFDVRWKGGGDHVKVHDETNHFEGRYVEGNAIIEWSGETENGQFFKSDPANTSTSKFSEVGRERNGVFFDDDDDDN
jgi:hypothetical protein